MPLCSLQIMHVNGIIPPGLTNPTELRVTGRATACLSNQVIVTSSVTNASPPTMLDPNGGFVVNLPLTTSLMCGDNVGFVQVVCDGNTTCQDSLSNFPLDCCTVNIVSINAVAPSGALQPTDISVMGTLLGCPNNQVVVSSSVTGTSPPTPVDPVTGSFGVILPVTTPVSCDDLITVTAVCSQNSACIASRTDRLNCPQCFRAQVSYTTAPCTSTPPMQPITLQATINIPAGLKQNFYWDYGDGTAGATFLVNNSAGTAATPYLHTEVHNYVPGAYTARLKIVPPPTECPDVLLPVVAQCGEPCPIAALSFSQDPKCVGGQRSVTLNATVTAPSGSPAAGQWIYGDGTFGPSFFVSAGTTSTIPSTTHSYSPGSYTATLSLSKPPSPPGCLDPSILVPVATCPLICPTLTLKPPQVTGCAPTNAAVTFNIDQLNWPSGSSPTAPTDYVWTVEGPTGLSSKKAQENTAGTVTSTKTSDTGWTGSGATSAGTVDLSQHGTYTVTVTAFIPGISPTPTCNVIATAPFQIPDCDTTPPTVASCSANASTGTVTVTFSEDVNSTLATTPANFTVTVNGVVQPLTGSQFSYAPNTTTITGVSIPAGASVRITVTNVQDKAGNTIVANGQTNTCNTQPPDITPPTVASCSANASTGTITVTFSEDVDSTSATTPANFTVTVNGVAQTLTSSQLSYSPNTTTITGVSIPAGATVTITVMNVTDRAGNTIIANGTTNTCSTTTPPTTGGGLSLCLILLVIWLLAFIAIALLLFYNQFNIYLVIAIIVFIIFFVLWIIFCCRKFCIILQWLFIATSWVLTIFGILGILCTFLPPFCGNPTVAAGYGALNGALLAAMAAGSCGTIPNPLDPRTWPGPTC